MNPENCGPHIQDKHSTLWRKSMFNQKAVPNKSSCHGQLNEFASTMNESWRTRNNFIKTNLSGVTRASSLRQNKSEVESVLADDKMQSPKTKQMIKTFLVDKNQLDKSQKLIEGISKLKQIKLLQSKELNNVKYPGIIRHEHIYNDYHTKTTNPGYKRGDLGRMFAK